MNLRNRTRQRRYYLKGLYFDKVEDKTKVMRTPPFEVHHMSADEWCSLVDNWSTPQKQVMSLFTQPCYFSSSILWIVANLFILYVCVGGLFESHQKQTTRLVPLSQVLVATRFAATWEKTHSNCSDLSTAARSGLSLRL